MTPNDRAKQVLPGNWLTRLQEENLEIMRRGLAGLSGVSPAWWKTTQGAAGEIPGFSAEAWIDLLSKNCRDMSAALPDTLKGIGCPIPWDALFNGWKRFTSNASLVDLGLDSSAACSESWQKSQMGLFDALKGCLEKIAQLYEAGGEGQKAIEGYRESSGRIVAIWRNFTEEQTRGFFDFLESFQESKTAAGKKREAPKQKK